MTCDINVTRVLRERFVSSLIYEEVDVENELHSVKKIVGEEGPFLEDCIFHLAVELLCSGDSARAAYIIFRLLGHIRRYTVSDAVRSCAFAMVCRSTIPSNPGVIDLFLSFRDADPFKPVDGWPCACSSRCELARKMCQNKSPAALAIFAMNFSAADRCFFETRGREPTVQLLAPVYRSNRGFPPTQVSKMREVVETYFPEKENEAIISAAKLIATVEEGIAGRGLNVDEVGKWIWKARDLLSELKSIDGERSILFLVADIDSSISGRDAVFRYLVRMLTISADTRCLLIESVVRSNPSFWISQLPSESTAPALTLECVPESLYSHFHHLSDFRKKCQCGICMRWKRSSGAFEGLELFMRAAGDAGKLEGHRLVHQLSLGDPKSVRLKDGIDLSVSDFCGNTALHLISDVDFLHQLALAGADSNVMNRFGRLALDLAVQKNEISKVGFLLQECHSPVSVKSLEGILAVIDGNKPLLKVVRESLQSISIEVPEPGAIRAIGKLRLELDRERRSGRDMERSHKRKLDELLLESETRREVDLANLKKAAEEKMAAFTKIAELELTLVKANQRRQSVETEKQVLEEQVSKLKKHINSFEKEREQFKLEHEGRECTVCMERWWDCSLYCGHCYCLSCIQSACQLACPTCSRKTSGKFIQLFSCRK